MRKRIFISCLFAVLCSAQNGLAADPDHEADHQALRAMRDNVEKAVNAGNMQDLSKYMAKEFTFITSDQTVINDAAGLAKYWDSMFKSGTSPVIAMTSKLNADILTQFIGRDIGYCYGTTNDIYTLRNKRKVALTSRWSVLLVKEQDEWKARAVHVGVNFLNNPMLEAKELSWLGRVLVALHLRRLPGEVKE